MTTGRALLQELDDAVSRGSDESRAKALWHATDLLIAGRYSEDQIWIFGEVIGRLAEDIEVTARAQLAKRLAVAEQAPSNLINRLAFDDSIEVAGPVLQQSERLDVRSLVAIANTKSQQHLLAISKRKSLDQAVTDALVTRGNLDVARSVAANHGARFSDCGLLHLVRRSENDSILAENIGTRRDIPRQLFHQLIAKASDDVKKKLQQERPDIVNQIETAVTEVAGTVHAKFGPASPSYFAAKKVVGRLHECGQLNEKEILYRALAHRFEETIVGLSVLCGLPSHVVERVLMDSNREMLLVVAKHLKLSWETTTALLFLGAPDHRISSQDLDDMGREFGRLNCETARNILKLYQSRKETAASYSGTRRLPQLHTS
jgi:uncharacterized protein (DUF2336 family)